MPTPLCLLYLAAVLAAAAFRAYYIGWLGVYLFRVVLLLPLLLLLCSLPAMLSAHSRIKAPRQVQCAAAAHAVFRVTLRSVLPFGALRAKICIHNLCTDEIVFTQLRASGAQSSAVSFPLPSAHCGRLEISVAAEHRFDLLGLLRLRARGAEGAAATVMPVPAPPASVPDLETALGLHRVLRPKPGGGYAEEHELRDYRPGDPMRAMHWKLSSKMDKPIIREPLSDENRHILVLFDPDGNTDRSFGVLYWLCERLMAMELPHQVVWGTPDMEKYAVIDSPGRITAMFEELLSAPVTALSGIHADGVRCRFTVKNGEVMYQ